MQLVLELPAYNLVNDWRMKMMRELKRLRFICLLAVGAAMLTQMTALDAQTRSTAERRQRPGMGFWANQRAQRELRHAREYTQDLYEYSRSVDKIAPDVAKNESDKLGQKIDAAKKEFAAVKDELSKSNDADVLKSLKVIDEHLSSAEFAHKHLHEVCTKDVLEGAMVSSCCIDVAKELEKASAEHNALMRKLELKATPKAEE